MKKIWKALFLLTLGTFTFTSCEDVPEPYPVPGMNGGNKPNEGDNNLKVIFSESFDNGVGNFTFSNVSIGTLSYVWKAENYNGSTYLKASAYANNQSNTAEAWAVSPAINLKDSKTAELSFRHAINKINSGIPAEMMTVWATTNYNGDASTANWTQLTVPTHPDGTSWTFVNSGNIDLNAFAGQEKVYIGFKYLSTTEVAGSWEIDEFKVLGDGTPMSGEQEPSGDISKIYSQSFDSEDNGFVFSIVSKAEELSYIWKTDSYGYLKASAYANNTTYASEAWAVSPAINLKDSKVATLNFRHAINKINSGIPAEMMTVWASTDFTGNAATAKWTKLTVPTYPEGTSWTFVSAGDIDLSTFAGQEKVYIGFKYTSTSLSAGTWEVDEFVILGDGTPMNNTGSDDNTPDEPTTPVEPGENMLVYGGFEAWSGSTPTGWKTASTAGNATLSQSTDAKSGSYAVEVAGLSSANKRLGSTEMTLSAGTYTFTVSVKAATSEGGSFSLGYVPVVDGKVGTYTYQKEGGKQVYYNNLSATEWTTASYTFTLDAETTVSLLVMNAKNPGKNILVDDASLTSENGSIVK